MVWTNQNLTLFHGTHSFASETIRSDQRFRLDLARRETDFGRGIYTTTNFNQAEGWAIRAAARLRKASGNLVEPRVMTANLNRMVLSDLTTLFFTRSNEDFWDLVTHCRAGNNHAIKNDWYDVVAGPLTRFPLLDIFQDSDQISFHTETACALLWNSIDWDL